MRSVSLSTPSGEVELAPGQDANCLVRNRIIPGTIEIEKNATPESSQEFPFTGAPRIGDFTLVDDRTDEERLRDIPRTSRPGPTRSASWFPPAGSSRDLPALLRGPPSTIGPQATITLAARRLRGMHVATTRKSHWAPSRSWKEAKPQSDRAFSFSGSPDPLKAFTLVDNGEDGPPESSRTFTDLPPGTYTINEMVPAGWELTGIACNPANAVTIDGAEVKITIGRGTSVACTYGDARIPLGTIKILKEANPNSSREFKFSGSPDPLEAFTLVDNGEDEPESSRTFTDLQPGTYTVRETVPEDWTLTGVACTPEEAVTIDGAEDKDRPIGRGTSVACAYGDARIEPPPPDPPRPPDPPTPPGSAERRRIRRPRILRRSTRLAVVKTMPRIVRVGRRVPFTLTVTNIGEATARSVRMVDVPPAALRLSALRASRKARQGRGYVAWQLGNLDRARSAPSGEASFSRPGTRGANAIGSWRRRSTPVWRPIGPTRGSAPGGRRRPLRGRHRPLSTTKTHPRAGAGASFPWDWAAPLFSLGTFVTTQCRNHPTAPRM